MRLHEKTLLIENRSAAWKKHQLESLGHFNMTSHEPPLAWIPSQHNENSRELLSTRKLKLETAWEERNIAVRSLVQKLKNDIVEIESQKDAVR